MSELDEQIQGGGESSKPPVERRLIEVAAELGFAETPEILQTRERLVPDMLTDEAVGTITDYQRLGEEIIDQSKDSDNHRTQIGLIVAVAGIKHTYGFLDEYRYDLNQAIMYATGINDHDTVRRLRGVLLENIDFRDRKTRK